MTNHKCSSCETMNNFKSREVIKEAGSILLLVLDPLMFNNQTNTTQKVTTPINIGDIPSLELILSSNKYQFKSAIFHMGNSLASGHYISIIKTMSGLIECDDIDIKPCSWPKNSIYKSEYSTLQINPYILMYEKC